VDVTAAALCRGRPRSVADPRLADLAIHLPAYPKEEYATGQGQADDREQRHGKIGEQDAQDRRGGDPERDDAASPRERQSGRCHSNDDRVVAGEHHVDDDHRQQGAELINADQHFRQIVIEARPVEAATITASAATAEKASPAEKS